MNQIEIDGINYEMIGIFTVSDQDYLAVFTLDGKEEIYFYRYQELKDGYELYDILDDEEFDNVKEEFEYIQNNQLYE